MKTRKEIEDHLKNMGIEINSSSERVVSSYGEDTYTTIRYNAFTGGTIEDTKADVYYVKKK